MAIRVYLEDVLKARSMTSKELCALVGITEANLSILRSGKARASVSARSTAFATFCNVTSAIF